MSIRTLRNSPIPFCEERNPTVKVHSGDFLLSWGQLRTIIFMEGDGDDESDLELEGDDEHEGDAETVRRGMKFGQSFANC